jgi:predicted Zn-dependent protease
MNEDQDAYESPAAATPPPVAVPAQKEAGTGLKSYIKWLILAAVLVTGLLVWAPWSGGRYQKYAFSKQMPVTARGADQQGQLNKAAELYNKGDFAEARKVLVRLYTETPQSPFLSYYFAITLIETGQTYEARTILIHLAAGSSVFKYDATFYTALSLIKEDKETEAITWLEKIPADNANYDKAKALIAELKK